MTGCLFLPGAADRFNTALEAAGDGGNPPSRAALDGEAGDLLALAARLRDASASVRPPPAFRAELLEQLMAAHVDAADDEPEPADGAGRGSAVRRLLPPGVGTARGALLAAAAFVLIAVGITAIIDVSRHPAGPALATRQIAQGQAQLGAAQQTVTEVLTAGRDPRKVAAAVDDLNGKVRGGVALVTTGAVENGDRAALDELARWAHSERARLAGAQHTAATPAGREQLQDAVDLLGRVEQRAKLLAPQVDCPCMDNPTMDDLGPVPCLRCADPSSPPSASPSADDSGEGMHDQAGPDPTLPQPAPPKAEPPAIAPTPAQDPPAAQDPEPSVPSVVVEAPQPTIDPPVVTVPPVVIDPPTPVVTTPEEPAIAVDLPILPPIIIGGLPGD